jgi:hypothetical protein
MEQKPQTGRFSREQVGPYGRDPDRQAKKKDRSIKDLRTF